MCAKRGLTGTDTHRITWDHMGWSNGSFFLSQSESWMPEEYPKLLQNSKHFQNTQTMPVWKFALNGSSPNLVFLGRVNIERSCQWISNLNDIHTRVCTLMSSHDIDIIIIKHWLVLHNTSLITSYLTGGEICCITLYAQVILSEYFYNYSLVMSARYQEHYYTTPYSSSLNAIEVSGSKRKSNVQILLHWLIDW